MIPRRFNVLARFREWKRQVDSILTDETARRDKLEAEVLTLSDKVKNLESLSRSLVVTLGQVLLSSMSEETPGHACFAENQRFCIARRGHRVRILSVDRHDADLFWLVTSCGERIVDAVQNGEIDAIDVARMAADGTRCEWKPAPWLLGYIKESPEFYRNFLQQREALEAGAHEAPASEDPETFARRARTLVTRNPDLIDFAAQAQGYFHPTLCATETGVPPPFQDDGRWLPPLSRPAQPRKRSVVFLHNNYYHFNHLAEGLKRRGWDALTVSLESPSGPHHKLYHGEDLNLFDSDRARMRQRVGDFFKTIPERFEAVHFYSWGRPSFYVENFEDPGALKKLPWDFLELKRHRVIIGFMPTGCQEGTLQSSIRSVSGGLCGRCIWEQRPEICSDARNKTWLVKQDLVADWISLDGDWITPERTGPRFVTRPVVTCLSPELWTPELDVPDELRIERKPGEILVYHGVANDHLRRWDGRDIKGTGAVLDAIERLRAEGAPVRLFFATDIPSTKVRYYQVQADIVVDQLNYGRLGANARESLMLGRPLITSIKPGTPALDYLLEVPAVHASEESIYAELKALALDPERRHTLGKAGREFAIKWHSPDNCARRFERVIDRVRAGLPAEDDEVYAPETGAAASA